MSTYKLIYFNAAGRAELSRWVFEVAGEKYEDVRVDLECEQWKELKPKTPFGQLPLLEVDSLTMCQSNTIARFLAKRFGLVGKTDIEEALVNMYVDCVHDIWLAFMKTVYGGSDEDKAVAKAKWEKEERDKFLAYLEKLLSSNSGGYGYFVGNGLTLADLAVTNVLDFTGNLENYPKLKALKVRVKSNDGLSKWLASRPVTKM